MDGITDVKAEGWAYFLGLRGGLACSYGLAFLGLIDGFRLVDSD